MGTLCQRAFLLTTYSRSPLSWTGTHHCTTTNQKVGLRITEMRCEAFKVLQTDVVVGEEDIHMEQKWNLHATSSASTSIALNTCSRSLFTQTFRKETYARKKKVATRQNVPRGPRAPHGSIASNGYQSKSPSS